MARRMYIQLVMPWEVAGAYLSPGLVKLVSPLVDPRRPRLAWIVSDAEDPRLAALIEANQVVAGESLIRAIHTRITIEEREVEDDGVYVVRPSVGQDEYLKLLDKMGRYFRLSVECRLCGRFAWEQTRNLELAEPMRLDLEGLKTYDLAVSARLKDVLEQEGLTGFRFRPIGTPTGQAWQIVSCGTVPVKRPQPTVTEWEFCTACGRPRRVVDEDSNGVEVLEPHDIPAIDRTPTLLVTAMNCDFGRTDQEFGTLGRVPPGGTPCDDPEPWSGCKTSSPKWVVSGLFARVLFRENVGGFELEPAEIVE